MYLLKTFDTFETVGVVELLIVEVGFVHLKADEITAVFFIVVPRIA